MKKLLLIKNLCAAYLVITLVGMCFGIYWPAWFITFLISSLIISSIITSVLMRIFGNVIYVRKEK